MKSSSLCRFAFYFSIFFAVPFAFAQEPMDCVKLNPTATGGVEVKNNCSYLVTAHWCVVGYDCRTGRESPYSSMTNIKPGNSYPVSGSRGRSVEFAACEGRDIGVRVVGRQFQCTK